MSRDTVEDGTGLNLENATRVLRERSAGLADELNETARRVSTGTALPDDVLRQLGDWSAARSDLAENVRAAGLTWAADQGFAELDALLDALRTEREARAARARELASLREQLDTLRGFLEQAGGGGGAYSDALRTTLTTLEGRIAELESTPAQSSPHHAPAPREDPAAITSAPGSTPESDTTSVGGGADGERDTGGLGPAARARRAPLPDGDDGTRTTDESRPDTAPPGAPAAPVPPEPVAEAHRVGSAADGGTAEHARAEDCGAAEDERPDHETAEDTQAEDGTKAENEKPDHDTPEDERPEPDPETTEDETAEDEETPGDAAGSHFPWQDGDQVSGQGAAGSPVARLVAGGRFQEAYWLTVGSAEPGHRAECLAFAAAAFSCDSAEEATQVMTRFPPDPDVLHGDQTALMLAAVASLRAGLVAGWPNDLLLQADPASTAPGPWGKLLASAVDMLRRYQRVDRTRLTPTDGASPTLTRSRIAKEAATLAANLPQKRIGYARATQVQNRLIGPEQPLGRALAAVQEWAAGQADASVLDDAWEAFRKRDSSERIIEEADAAIRTPKQAKEPIEAMAKRALLHRIEQVATLLSQARALAAPGAEESIDNAASLRHVLDGVRGAALPPGVEGAALSRLRDWLLGEDCAPVPRPVLDAAEGGGDAGGADFAGMLGAEALLAAPELPRSRDGAPLPHAPGFAESLTALLEPVDIRGVLTRYADRGDLHLADALVEALEQGLVPAAPAGTWTLPSDWRVRRDAEWARWSSLRREAHRVAAGLLAELRTQQSLHELTERELAGVLERLEQPSPAGAFRATVEDLRKLEEELRRRVQEYMARLHEQLEALPMSEQDRKRLTALLRAGDTVTAEECLALLRKGDALPDWSGVDWGEELARFMAGLGGVTPHGNGQRGFSAQPWAGLYAEGQPLTEGAKVGLESWDALCRPNTRGSEWQKHVPSVLRVLGLEGRPPTRDDHRQVRGILRLSARLSVSESTPGYVAALGSAATTYTVLVVFDELRGRSPLELLDGSDTGACIILYLYPLGLAGRRGMAAHARTSAQQALVVDPAVFGWIAARSPRSFRAVQRVTLPWTAFNPYTPFVAGLVPPEVFYGRSQEMATVTDQLGALFLYGGRQLGKSALLRKVEATFPSTPERRAVYLDLRARGVGEAEPAERIWSVLAAELKRVGVLGPKVSTEVGPDVLLSQVRRWLSENRERRVLVLADEADAFLTADSKAAHGRGGEGTFANVSQLKGLMDDTDRRFKIVFAGLHQVQRFSHLSNVPLAHGGPDVLIGPLKPAEAQRLVVEPMAAFGYRFESPELVWRVLAATNYQACLVQIFCERLVAALHEKPLGSALWPIPVTEEDVRAVAGSTQVHRNIAERLRITINLEDRYRVLALVIALRSQADGFQRGYDADELLGEAKLNWPEGFRKLTASDVKIYLDEMAGLGLLIQQADRRSYAVRSPNVVHMLGTREDLELELRQTEFSLPYDYNPRFSRRLVGQDSKGIARYSPLTEQQLYDATSAGVTALCLTQAHAPKLVSMGVRSYADARGLKVHQVTADELVGAPSWDTRGRQPSVVVADLRAHGADTIRRAMDRLHTHTSRGTAVHRAAVVLLDPGALQEFHDERVTRLVRPERWNADSLRAWPECPFDTPDKRRKLVEATGGWPSLVERTVDLATRGGATLEAALEQVQTQCARPDVARTHLSLVELDQPTVELLQSWAEYVDPGESCGSEDIAAVTGLALDDVHRLTTHLNDHGVLDDSENGYALDPVTFRALGAAGHAG
ncbi:hypothetical protein [Streptomyces sp.]|uniref:hypothetical protein n=1 Tax=Streptomyces sp. TaxID=1931 RepID=UPI002F3E28B4